MPVFRISARTVSQPVPPKRSTHSLPSRWKFIAWYYTSMFSAGLLFTLLLVYGQRIFHQQITLIFILLPVLLSFATAPFRGYNLNVLLRGTSVYLLLMGLLTLIYYSFIILGVSFIQQSTTSHIIVIATALAWTIMLNPLSKYTQKFVEQRFNRRDRAAIKTIEAFVATLREEIDLDQLCERVLTVIQSAIHPYSVTLWTRTSNEQQEQANATEEILVADDDALVIHVLRYHGPLDIDRLQFTSPALQVLKSSPTEILLPLANQGELIGLLILGPHLKGKFYTAEERILLKMLASQVAPALRVALMVRTQQKQIGERERMEQELRTARLIQRSLLPEALPRLAGWRLATYYQPAQEVGGDFYDFIPFEDGRLGLVIGDATDKGMPAALVMTTTCTMLRTAAVSSTSPSEVLARVNDLLYTRIPARMFVTCFYAVLDPRNGHLHYANAGQDWPFRRYEGGIAALQATGMPLGMLPGTRYEEHEVTLELGESLLLFSDGLVEAHNAQRDLFGLPHLMTLLEAYTGDTTITDYLLHELRKFTGEGWEQEDDVTLVELQRIAQPFTGPNEVAEPWENAATLLNIGQH